MDEEVTKAEAKLLRWYTSLSPLRVDIAGDFAGKEVFAIHGDSLLLHSISEARVDFHDGFQLLHAIHAVESFLENLRARGCNFHVVWFLDHEQLCVPERVSDTTASKYRLTRAILIRHLDHRPQCSNDIQNRLSFQFESIGSKDFQEYLAQNAIHFFLSLDGQELRRHPRSLGVSHVSFIHHLSCRGYCVAIMNDLEFVSSKVHVSVLSPSLGRNLFSLHGKARQPRAEVRSMSELEMDLRPSPFSGSPWDGGQPLSGRDLVSLIALCNILLMDSRDGMRNCIVAYIVHLCVLRRSDLSERSCPELLLEEPLRSCVERFFGCFSDICVSVLEKMDPLDNWDCFDLCDGRIVRQVYKNLPILTLPGYLCKEVQKFGEIIHQLTGFDLSGSMPKASDGKATKEADFEKKTTGGNPSVLPFSHPVLDRFLASVHVPTAASSDYPSSSRIFEELSHWHNARALLDPKSRPSPKGHFAKMRQQKLMASIMAYSASLASASGNIIAPEVIVSSAPDKVSQKEDHRRGEPGRSKAPRQHNAKRSGHGGGRKFALQEAQRIQDDKVRKKAIETVRYWSECCREFEKEPKLDIRYKKICAHLARLSEQDMSFVGADALLYLCKIIVGMLLEARRKGAKMNEMGLLAILWSKLVEISALPLSQEGAAMFEMFSKLVKLPIAVRPDRSMTGRKLPFTCTMATSSGEINLPLDPIEFQLIHCGPYLERGFDPAPDARVPFRPDAWQRNVLDAIDANKSLFVVAPTSSGKTFISFYAMKKVLQSNNEDLLVYVAPTKALVNQIAAEVQARFSKSYANEGKSVWAVHTKDYRINNSTGCQVLITVPHILQIMLLAPANSKTAKSWSLRVKRIIFDEVHCIGQSDEGVVWEQLLLLAPCPIIALSATVGNPLDFKHWLEESERAKGHKLEMIAHSSRYSDLRKFVYCPEDRRAFKGLQPAGQVFIPGLDEDHKGRTPFSYIHPVASLMNRNRGSIDDMSLEPRDCFILWQCMRKHQNQLFPLDDALDPRNALPSVAKKRDVLRWETALKRVLEVWMHDIKSPFASLRRELQATILPHFVLDQGLSTPESNVQHAFGHHKAGQEGLKALALPLLEDLHSHGSLPAILFNYDRNMCEKIALAVSKQLIDAEAEWKDSAPAWKKKLFEYEKWKSSKSPKSQRRTSPNLTREETVREEADADASGWEIFDPEASMDMFSFADRKKLPDSEFKAIASSLQDAHMRPGIVDALHRGIGVHHAGMNRQYRQVVEMLFRKGFLRVVIATGTLALGLNMPCKTVVFFGDSVFLTALNYNQAAGRAGRRGFDVLGNVVFAGMPPERVFEILSSRLPDLRGQFPFSTTLVLRLLGLLHSTANSDFAVKAIECLQSQSRLYLGGPSNQMAIKHHLRFSIEYLQRQQLLSQNGAPLNFAGLVGHLYYTENAVFAFHSLLKAGYFHVLSSDICRTPKDVALELVLVLAHLFCRVPLSGKGNEGIREKSRRSPSVVVLPALPVQAEIIVRQHNDETLAMFQNYVSLFVDQHLQGKPDNQLPLTKLKIQKVEGGGKLAVLDRLPPTRVRSPFSALSGFTDDFESIRELCSSIREGVFLEESCVPYSSLYPKGDPRLSWNAYIYDFFKHGDMEALVRDNGISRGDVWFRLKDFSLVLATIATSLSNVVNPSAADDDLATMNVQDDLDSSLEREEPELQSSVEEEVAKDTGWVSAKNKKITPDSWEDEVSLESPQDEGAPSSSSGSPFLAAESAGRLSGDESLVSVLRAFRQVQTQFDEMFKKVWA